MIIPIVTNPVIYSFVVGIMVGMYVVWRQAKASYLSVNKIFNLWCLVGVSGGLGMLIGGVWHQGMVSGWSEGLWYMVGNQVKEFLEGEIGGGQVVVGFLLGILAGWWYVREIRYPGWRLADMMSFGWMSFGVILSVGWLVAEFGWQSGGELVFWAGWMALLGWLYKRQQLFGMSGVIFGGWILGWAVWIISKMAWQSFAWQGGVGRVEWLYLTIMVLFGLGVVWQRGWQQRQGAKKGQLSQSPEMPKGVSEAFRESFSRMKSMTNSSVALADSGEGVKPDDQSRVTVSKSADVAVVVSDESEVIAPPVETKVKNLLKKRGSRKK